MRPAGSERAAAAAAPRPGAPAAPRPVAAALLAAASMDDSRHSVRSGGTSVASENFYATNDWDPAPSRRRTPPRPRPPVLESAIRERNMAMAELLNSHGCVVEHSEQHRDRELGGYFQRAVFDWSAAARTSTFGRPATASPRWFSRTGRRCAAARRACNGRSTRSAAASSSSTSSSGHAPKTCVFVSKYDHVLWEILLRHKAGELPCDIPLIISNHADLKPVADAFGVRFEVFKVTKATKREVEDAEIRLMEELEIDLVVLARYMQIISDEFCATYPCRVINIHHSFLPAFIGSKPYHRAHERGVKLIGATAHYATANLDEGRSSSRHGPSRTATRSTTCAEGPRRRARVSLAALRASATGSSSAATRRWPRHWRVKPVHIRAFRAIVAPLRRAAALGAGVGAAAPTGV